MIVYLNINSICFRKSVHGCLNQTTWDGQKVPRFFGCQIIYAAINMPEESQKENLLFHVWISFFSPSIIVCAKEIQYRFILTFSILVTFEFREHCVSFPKPINGLHWYIAQSLNLKKVYSKSFYLITSYRTNFFLRKNLHECSCTWHQNVFQSNGVPERVLNHVNNFALRKKSHLVFILSRRILNMLNLKA